VSYWNSLALPWKAALKEAWTAYCHGSLPIGAVIVRDDEIISRGRNRIAEPHGIDRFISGTQISHAELNAIVQLPQQLEPRGLALYTTMEPCPLCAGAVAMASLKTVHFAAHDAWAGFTRIFENDPYLNGKRIVLHAAQDRTLELICSALCLHSDFEDRGDTPENNLLRAFQREQPAALQLARDLFKTGVLLKWRETRVTIEEVVNGIAQQLEVIA
jgi:tRNA(adenine34) deaminase